MSFFLPSYTNRSAPPSYTPTPSENEHILGQAALSRESNGGTFVRSDPNARLTIMLDGQKEDSINRPILGRGSAVTGTVFVGSPESIVAVNLKVEGLMEALSVSLGYQATKVVNDILSLFSKTGAPCPSSIPFSYRFPAMFGPFQNSYQLPPSCNISFRDGGFLKCVYSLTVVAVYRSVSFLMKERSVHIELNYRQRTRPSRPRISDPTLFATIKVCPEEWLQLPVELTVGAGDTRQPSDLHCDLFVPSIGVFALVEAIPFHIQLSGPLGVLRSFLLLSPRADNGHVDTVRQPIRVYLLRQTTLSTPEKGAIKVNATLYEAALRPLPPPHSSATFDSQHRQLDSASLNWEGELHVQNADLPSFDAGTVNVAYLIAVEITPPRNITSATINRARYGVPVKLTTDTWAGSAESPD
ncbi:DUF3844 domain-containing protein [Mycena indigotica]|uniref:DUF3844 domain-containing protein n=1 Tax=Mycena indigotica TaxID=2126181 RepID=A0A8H6WEQ5_9AGAR|nr:DUF3844 domain-containing protein [Mycena indigotica]KAF7315944.1 DUF3844 domain-containing protein [Mycena indigotica]